jgi:serine/threonine protein kinase
MPLPAPLTPGFLLDNRYEVVRCLGRGGFGRTYLAKDRHRFDERCLLKEFAPQDTTTLQKATELFEREAGILYQLKHPQIPTFRALLTGTVAGQTALFLVEQYIEGQSYAQWLQQGHRMSEADAIRLLLDLLPVLAYLHDRGVIHRDISPDNLIAPHFTGKPVLIDFGSVKQVVQAAQYSPAQPGTQVRKPGYTPPEQFRGEAYPSSDLYALAVTVLVLMTDRSPLSFYDDRTLSWNWRSTLRLHPALGVILDRMLATRLNDRYPSAQEVLQALQPLADLAAPGSDVALSYPAPAVPIAPAPVSHTPSTVKTVVVAPAAPQYNPTAVPIAHQLGQSPVPPTEVGSAPKWQVWKGLWRSLGWLVLSPFRLLRLALNLVGFSVRAVNWLTTAISTTIAIGVILAIVAIVWQPQWLSALAPKLEIPQLEIPQLETSATCKTIVDRHEALGIPLEQFYETVNQRLYAQYPELQGRLLTTHPEDERFRQAWCDIAKQLVTSQLNRDR